jgi:hypothetical protein
MNLPELRELAQEKGVKFTSKSTKAQIEKAIKMADDKKTLKEGIVTDAQLKEWKDKYNKNGQKVQKISVEVSEGDTAVGYLKPPTRDHKAIALTSFNNGKILETGEFLIQNCWLGGDERIKNNPVVNEAAAVQANGIVNFLKGSLEEA